MTCEKRRKTHRGTADTGASMEYFHINNKDKTRVMTHQQFGSSIIKDSAVGGFPEDIKIYRTSEATCCVSIEQELTMRAHSSTRQPSRTSADVTTVLNTERVVTSS